MEALPAPWLRIDPPVAAVKIVTVGVPGAASGVRLRGAPAGCPIADRV